MRSHGADLQFIVVGPRSKSLALWPRLAKMREAAAQHLSHQAACRTFDDSLGLDCTTRIRCGGFGLIVANW